MKLVGLLLLIVLFCAVLSLVFDVHKLSYNVATMALLMAEDRDGGVSPPERDKP